jgi:SAM-dependent methyltransferase
MRLGVERGIDTEDANDGLTAATNEEQTVSKENGIYGSRWNAIHHGYFSDSKVAFPLIEVIKRAIEANHPNVVVDLGGGTGFILKELLKYRELSNMLLVNVDISPLQLSECVDERISYLQASVDQITRSQFQTNDNGLMMIARSLLHYFGYSGLRPLLRHIRRQLVKGEIFVHQSACFEKVEDAECLNLVYKLMSTPKWYTTVNNLKSMLNDAGFSVCDVCPAVKLQLESNDLSERYQLNPQQIILIRKEIERLYGQKSKLFISSTDHFTAWLHYSIFTCKAI